MVGERSDPTTICCLGIHATPLILRQRRIMPGLNMPFFQVAEGHPVKHSGISEQMAYTLPLAVIQFRWTAEVLPTQGS